MEYCFTLDIIMKARLYNYNMSHNLFWMMQSTVKSSQKKEITEQNWNELSARTTPHRLIAYLQHAQARLLWPQGSDVYIYMLPPVYMQCAKPELA